MDFFGGGKIFALLTIVMADLMLAGDNALVIGMACRGLPPAHKRLALLWGTGGAVALRILLTGGVTLLLVIPFLQALGGILLIWVALKLLLPEKQVCVNNGVCHNTGLMGAIKTIIMADVVMSLDNVLAVAGAANGHPGLVVFGLALSIPIVIGGSQLVSLLVEKYPVLLFAGAAVLAWTAGRMLVEDRLVRQLTGITGIDHLPVETAVQVGITVLVLLAGWYLHRRGQKGESTAPSHQSMS
ncbi:TerC family protein [Desulfofundulus thermobenzoicus]|uniref:TerC family protein n=1 Tax=Desulfofundulus thermobenzoicus TaxID=29376 RepID=UPI00311AAE8B